MEDLDYDFEYLDHRDHNHNNSSEDSMAIVHSICAEKWKTMFLFALLASIVFRMYPYVLLAWYTWVIRSDSSLCKIVLKCFNQHLFAKKEDCKLSKNSYDSQELKGWGVMGSQVFVQELRSIHESL